MLVLDTAAAPRRDRLDLAVETLADAASATSFTPSAPEDVHLMMDVWDLGGLAVFDTACSAHTMIHAKPPASDVEPTLLLTFAIKGTGVHSQPTHDVLVRPSVVWATDLTAPYVHAISDTRTLTAKIPQAMLGAPVDDLRPVLKNVHRSPLAALFRRHLTDVCKIADDVEGATALSLGTATLSLARALVASVSPEGAARREALEDVLLLRVKSFVAAHLGETGLDAHAIAAAHFVSVRHLYKVCAAAGIRLEQWIIEQRLARAGEDLARVSDLTIGEVAYRWGFRSPAHFATRFRRKYGVSPREWQSLNRPPATPGEPATSPSRT